MDRIYISCLASYNNGVMHGKWINASPDVDDMQNEVDALLRSSRFPNVMVWHFEEYKVTDCVLRLIGGRTVEGSHHEVPSAEEYAIHDFEGEAFSGLGEYCGLAAVANRMELVELAIDALGADGVEIVMAYADHMGTSANETASDVVNAAQEAYLGTARGITEYAENYCDETGLLDSIPENLRSYFDYAAFGRDMELGGDVFTVDGGKGILVFSNH